MPKTRDWADKCIGRTRQDVLECILRVQTKGCTTWCQMRGTCSTGAFVQDTETATWQGLWVYHVLGEGSSWKLGKGMYQMVPRRVFGGHSSLWKKRSKGLEE